MSAATAIVLVPVTMVVTAPVASASECASFNDVDSGGTFCPGISWLVDQGITQGYSDGGFHPGADISRAATAASGESGNFFVHGDNTSVNEILGGDGFGVPSVTVALHKGDTITVSGISTVTFTATK